MAQYFFNEVNPVTIGAFPVIADVGELALKGAFDFPKRNGVTEYDWGDRYEAIVGAEDIEWKEREISFRVFIAGDNETDLNNKIEAFKNLCLNSNQLKSSYGLSLEIRLNKGITITEYLKHRTVVALAKFTVTNGILSGVLGSPSGGNGFRIDNYNFISDFGIYVQQRRDNRSISSAIDLGTTEKYTNDITNRQPRDIQLNCMMQTNSLELLTERFGKLHQLLAQEGLRILTFPDGSTHQVYSRDGLKVTKIHYLQAIATVQFYFKLREV